MLAAVVHWGTADWLALAHDLGDMGLLKDSTDRSVLATDLQQRLGYAQLGRKEQEKQQAGSVKEGAELDWKGREHQGQRLGYVKHGVELCRELQEHQHPAMQGPGGVESSREAAAGGHVNISFGTFAQVLLVLAVKYRWVRGAVQKRGAR